MMPWATQETGVRSEEHTSELQSHSDLVCRLLLEKKKQPADGASQPPITTKKATRKRVRERHHAVLQAAVIQHRVPVHDGAHAFFFFNDTATTEIYTLSLHDALPIYFDALFGFDSLVQALVVTAPGQQT